MSLLEVGVFGASGFAGAELLRLCAGHPSYELVFAAADSQAGNRVAALYPSLANEYPDLVFESWEAFPAGLDVAFVALPHGVSQQVIPKLDAACVVDLGADFRFPDVSTYETWYGQEHSAPDLAGGFALGIPELFRSRLAGVKAVAVPGCYVTTTAITLAPLLAGGLAEPGGIIVDAASGVSGAGREPKPATSFTTVSESFTAYGLLRHRHTPEMEMVLSEHAGTDVEVLFTPHLAPMSRGILATCYLRPTGDEPTEALLESLETAYADEPFVHVSEDIPSTKATWGSNSVHVTVRRDFRTGWIIAIGALDNLVKGAAGQAIQCANLVTGLGETTGLTSAGVYP